jgi:hypothetical protein
MERCKACGRPDPAPEFDTTSKTHH